MSTRVLAAACMVVVGVSFCQADEAFIFRVRKKAKPAKVEDVKAKGSPVVPDTYQARKGDTLWDVAGRFWNSPRAWPELWALNPHFQNPHRIDPGDPIFLGRSGRHEEIHLPLEALLGEAASGAEKRRAETVGTTDGREGRSPARQPIRTARGQAGHFVSSHRISPLALVKGQVVARNIFASGDDVLLSLSGGTALKAGDFATIYDDSLVMTHPLNGTFQGYLVRVLGHIRVRIVSGGEAVGEIVESYDVVPEGAAVMAYRKPLTEVMPQASGTEVKGVVLGGMPGQTLLGLEDVVFLDRGSIHGLQTGAVLEVPTPQEVSIAGGLADHVRPLARILVVSAQDKTATGVVLASRASVMSGQGFATVALSP